MKDWLDIYSQQDPEEVAWLQRRIRGAKSILEIGSCHGNSLLLFARVLAPGARIRSIDIGDGTDWREGVNTAKDLKFTIYALRDRGFDADATFADSKSDRAIAWAKNWAPYDFVFIDGDHSYDGVKADWLNYGPMAPLVGFHDIAYQPREVKRLWAEIKATHDTEEIVRSRMGIGLVTERKHG